MKKDARAQKFELLIQISLMIYNTPTKQIKTKIRKWFRS